MKYRQTLLFAILTASTSLFGQIETLRFDHLTPDDGLITATIRDVVQDDKGFIWIATTSGLNRYDGHEILTFFNEPSNPSSLSDSNIKCLYVDQSGTLWVGTRNGGLDRFDPANQTFTNYNFSESDSSSLIGNYVRDIIEDSDGRLWVGTATGLSLMNGKDGTFEQFSHDSNDSTSLAHNMIHEIYEDSKGNVWIGTSNGLSKWNNGSFINFYKENESNFSLADNKVYAISEKGNNLILGTNNGLTITPLDSISFRSYFPSESGIDGNRIYKMHVDRQGNIWNGIRLHGLALFDENTSKFELITQSQSDPTSLKADIITTIYQDRTDVIWFGTTAFGINIFKPQFSFIQHIKNNPSHQAGITAGPITSIVQDENQTYWIANMYGVIERLNEQLEVISTHSSFIDGGTEVNPGNIHDLLFDRSGNLWVSCRGGLYRYEPSSSIFQRYDGLPQLSGNVECYDLLLDQQGIIWITTSNGIMWYDPESGMNGHISSDPTKSVHLSGSMVYNLFESSQGEMWIGTESGLDRLNKTRDQIEHYVNALGNANSISSNAINVVFEDQSKTIWVGTESGLNKFIPTSNQFERYTMEDGLSDHVIYGILEGENKKLWIITLKSLSLFDPVHKTFKSYTRKNGLPVGEFYEHSHYQDRNGKMFFGGDQGFLAVNPKEYQIRETSPLVSFTDFKLFNKSVQPGPNTPLEQNITETQSIDLTYKDYVFSFEFVANDFVSPLTNSYSYKMEGFNENWTTTDALNRTATYTNLNPGFYTFMVKASNDDGTWSSEPTSIDIYIAPPWWQTTLAYVLYVTLFISTLFGFIQWRASRLNREKMVLQKLVDEKTEDLSSKNQLLEEQAEKLKELDLLKDNFFTNISHEFRTPLTVIMGLASRFQNELNDTGATIKRNAERLLQLINQLLELSKLESGSLDLVLTKIDLAFEVRNTLMLYESICEDRNIHVYLNDTPPIDHQIAPIWLGADREKLNKIISNVISNAIKFTPGGGQVNIHLESDKDGMCQLRVSNTGSEIPAEKLPYLFDRFYQADSATTRAFEGTGIGLSLVKELVDLHNGTISVTSDQNETSFEITLPSNANLDLPTTQEEIAIPVNIEITTPALDEIKSHQEDDDRLHILIVEDNLDLSKYIASTLSDEFRTSVAFNGEEGFQLAKEEIPDLIISDVMMPVMDGFELCRQLKINEKTNHIPVVLLTAKAARENKLEGLETGADDYLIKPFDETELNIRVKNLIEIRSKLQQKYQHESYLKPDEVVVVSESQRFINKLKSVIEDNISNDQFSVEELGNEIGMSRSQIHRKLKALTDQSITNFIRNYRLHRAADLIKQQAGSITEIAYQVGFGSQTYFSKSFQELFECSPTSYAEKHK
ncbi:MAG: response regulator [Cyclobacteriaceae bacterium]